MINFTLKENTEDIDKILLKLRSYSVLDTPGFVVAFRYMAPRGMLTQKFDLPTLFRLISYT